jgi:hypothetical protein
MSRGSMSETSRLDLPLLCPLSWPPHVLRQVYVCHYDTPDAIQDMAALKSPQFRDEFTAGRSYLREWKDSFLW